jgi:hypothetical protein
LRVIAAAGLWNVEARSWPSCVHWSFLVPADPGPALGRGADDEETGEHCADGGGASRADDRRPPSPHGLTLRADGVVIILMA